jgi:polysaccharide biosynthesis/export protein
MAPFYLTARPLTSRSWTLRRSFQITKALILALFLYTTPGALAQQPAAPPPAKPLPGVGTTPSANPLPAVLVPLELEYVLGPEDLIEISVTNHADLDKLHSIRSDGKITIPELGEVQAAGKTPNQLTKVLQTFYDTKLNNAEVTVDVRESHSRHVGINSTNNGLRSSGWFPLQPNMHLVELITVAGGLNVKPDRVSGKLMRGTQKIELDLVRAYKDPLSDANLLLQTNDLVLLEAKNPLAEEVYLTGAVGHTGHYPYTEQTTLISLLSEAGGVTEGAALTKAYVLRNGTKIPIDLRPALKLGQSDPNVNNFKLEIGDQVFVPEIENRYAVMGYVQRPQYYYIPEKGPINVLEALNLAGGQLPTGDLAGAGILRVVDGKMTVIKVNLNKLQKTPQVAYDMKMQPEDILYIPPKGPRGFVWQDILTPISTLSFLGFRLFH